MQSHTHYLWFNTKQRQEIIDVTDEVAEQVRHSGVREGFAADRFCISIRASGLPTMLLRPTITTSFPAGSIPFRRNSSMTPCGVQG